MQGHEARDRRGPREVVLPERGDEVPKVLPDRTLPRGRVDAEDARRKQVAKLEKAQKDVEAQAEKAEKAVAAVLGAVEAEAEAAEAAVARQEGAWREFEAEAAAAQPAESALHPV